MRRRVTIDLPVEGDWEDIDLDIFLTFRERSFERRYCKSFIPPHRIEYCLGSFSETGIENMRKRLADKPWKDLCKIEVRDEKSIFEELAENDRRANDLGGPYIRAEELMPTIRRINERLKKEEKRNEND